jgi:hypothetical protein
MDLNVTSTLQQYLEAHSVPTSLEGNGLVAGKMTASAWVYRKPSQTRPTSCNSTSAWILH